MHLMESHDPYLNHWADQAAAKTLAAHPDAKVITVAAGITPSGVVHVGNFREVMTVDLVARALRDRGAQVRFIYSWDDFDVFRKVPKGMPKGELLATHLGRSIVDVPDPYDQHDSYASHHIAQFEASLEPLGIAPARQLRQGQGAARTAGRRPQDAAAAARLGPQRRVAGARGRRPGRGERQGAGRTRGRHGRSERRQGGPDPRQAGAR